MEPIVQQRLVAIQQLRLDEEGFERGKENHSTRRAEKPKVLECPKLVPLTSERAPQSEKKNISDENRMKARGTFKERGRVEHTELHQNQEGTSVNSTFPLLSLEQPSEPRLMPAKFLHTNILRFILAYRPRVNIPVYKKYTQLHLYYYLTCIFL